MPITFGAIARATREAVTQTALGESKNGIRKVSAPKKQEGFDIVASTGEFANWILGGVMNVLNSISWQSVAGWIVAGAQFIVSFNWNISDDELEKAIAAQETAWYGKLGETLGTSLGWVMCGVVPGLLVGTINQAAMMHILYEVGEEAFDEVTDQLVDLARLTGQQQMNKFFTQLFMGSRALIKRAANGEADTLLGGGIAALLDLCPGLKETIKKWGEPGQKPWTISGWIQEQIETLPEGKVQEFAEEFVEGLAESCGQAIFAVGQGLDNYVFEQRMAKQVQQGKERFISMQLDPDDPDSKIVLMGSEQSVEEQALIAYANYKMLKNKDVGVMMGGEPIANTITTPGLPYMRITFSNNENKKVKPTYIDIHNIDRTKVDDWAELKAACGGANGYYWGAYWVEALLPDNNKIGCFAKSEDEGEKIVEALLKFSLSGNEPDKIRWTVRSTMKKGSAKKYDSTYNASRRQYPYEVIIVNQQRILNEENGRANRSGIYSKREAILPLWTATKPDNWNAKITELFSTPGANA